MKYVLVIIGIVFMQYEAMSQNTFELDPSQSMCITGKGPGQDAAINPFADSDCTAIVENKGKTPFSVRIQSKGKEVKIITVEPKSIKECNLPKGYELYLDTDQKALAEVTFEKT
jgi:hypothetical protein